MIERQLEPEYMDDPREASAYDAMDHTAVNAAFAEDLLVLGDPGSRLLDVGTGTALIPIEICDRHPTVQIVAVDAAVAMLDVARVNIAAAGHAERIQLEPVDAKVLPFDDASFDAVVSNSLIHHLPDPMEVMRHMARVLKSGGRLFIRDLVRPQSRAEVEKLVEQYAALETVDNQQLLRQSLFAALTLDEVSTMVAELGFPHGSVSLTSDRHWTWSAIKGD